VAGHWIIMLISLGGVRSGFSDMDSKTETLAFLKKQNKEKGVKLGIGGLMKIGVICDQKKS